MTIATKASPAIMQAVAAQLALLRAQDPGADRARVRRDDAMARLSASERAELRAIGASLAYLAAH
jgi:hypothetical protein